jgi:hypothetical protein
MDNGGGRYKITASVDAWSGSGAARWDDSYPTPHQRSGSGAGSHSWLATCLRSPLVMGTKEAQTKGEGGSDAVSLSLDLCVVVYLSFFLSRSTRCELQQELFFSIF